MSAVSLPEPLAAIVFDFDGVLVESLDIKRDAFAALYRAFGDAVVDRVVAYHTAHPGVSRYEKIRHFEQDLLGRTVSEQDVLKRSDEFSVLVEKAVVACPEVNGASALLRFLHERTPCFVASATPEAELRRIIEQRDWHDCIESAFGSPASKKQNLQRILQKVGAPGSRCLMVGDAIADFEAALHCGMRFIGRVPRCAASPFPPDVLLVGDMEGLTRHLAGSLEGALRR